MITKKIEIGRLAVHPLNPRPQIITEDIKELAANIANIGLLQPITVIPGETIDYVLYGSRRFLACKLAGLTEIPAILETNLSEEEIATRIIAENEQREEMHPMLEAYTYEHLCVQYGKNINEVAELLGRPVFLIRQRMALLALIPEIQELFKQNLIVLKDALAVSTIPVQEQKKGYKEYKKSKDISDITTLRNAKNNLSTILNWDITYNKIPNCVNCSFNSHTSLLFSNDADKTPVCSNNACFTKKHLLVIKDFIDLNSNDPNVIWILQYSSIPDLLAPLLKNIEITPNRDVITIDKPDDIDPEEYDNKHDLKEAQQEFEQQMAEYNKAINSGEYSKVIIIKYHSPYFDTTLGKLKKVVDKNKPVNEANSKSEINFEINKIKEREVRKDEIDDEKITQNIFEVIKGTSEKYSSVPYPDCTKKHLSNIEKAILLNLIKERIGYDLGLQFDKLIPTKYRVLKYNSEIPEIPINIIYEAIRFYIKTGISGVNNYKKGGFSALLYLLIQEWDPETFKLIIEEQTNIKQARKTRVQERISKLKTKV